MREFAENLEAGFNLLALQGLQALGAELLHGERSHHAAVEESTLQHLTIDFFLRRQISHEASSKRIAGSRRIFHFIDGQRGRAKRMPPDAECALTKENRRAVFAVFDDQRLRAHREYLLRC